MKKLTFTVSVEFADKVTSDNEINEVADNVLKALVNEVNGNGLAPEESETFTTKVNVSNQVTGYDTETSLFQTKAEKEVIELGNYLLETEDENGLLVSLEKQREILIDYYQNNDKTKIVDWIDNIQVVELYENRLTVEELLTYIGYLK